MRIIEDKKPVRIVNRDKPITLTYEELGLTPINLFDYENYEKVFFTLIIGLVSLLWDKIL